MQRELTGSETQTTQYQCTGYRLTTAEIIYRMPDHPAVLQTFVWQKLDLPPSFPELKKFLAFWEKNLDGPLHSVRIGHVEVLSPVRWRALETQAIIH